MTLDQITVRMLRTADWKPVYVYPQPGFITSYGFTTYACDQLPGLTITKEWHGQFKSRSLRHRTIYQFQGRKTDSPTQIVRYWNEAARAAKQDGRPAPGSAEQVRQSRRGAGV